MASVVGGEAKTKQGDISTNSEKLEKGLTKIEINVKGRFLGHKFFPNCGQERDKQMF